MNTKTTKSRYMIDASAGRRLLQLFNWSEDFVSEPEQEYYYYDTLSRKLHAARITLCAKVADGVVRLQAYSTQVQLVGGNTEELAETLISSQAIYNIPDAISRDHVHELTGIEEDVKPLGMLTTRRHKLPYLSNVLVCLDANTYCGQTDYELEIEYTAEAGIPNSLIAVLADTGVYLESAPSPISKYSRFLAKLDGDHQVEVPKITLKEFLTLGDWNRDKSPLALIFVDGIFRFTASLQDLWDSRNDPASSFGKYSSYYVSEWQLYDPEEFRIYLSKQV